MTCAQGLLRLLWGGPEVGVLRDWLNAPFTRANNKKLFDLPKHHPKLGKVMEYKKIK